MSDLDAILKGEDVVDEQTAEVGTDNEPAEDVVEETTEETKGEDDTKGETPAPEVEKEEPWTKKAVLDERRKRQELEAKLRELESKTKEGKPEAPDVFEDAEGYTKYLQQHMQNNMLNMSEFLARREFPDLDEKVARFEQMVQENPMLYQKAMSSPSPYHEVVNIVRKAEELDKMSDIDSYKAKLRDEIKAELMAEMKATEARTSKGREAAKSVPKSLAGQASQGAITETVTDDDLQSILGR